MKAACDCTDTCYGQGDQSECFKINPDDECSYQLEQAGCYNVTAFPLVYQHVMPGSSFESAYICGKPDGKSYISVQRPISDSEEEANQCPEGTIKCSDTSPEKAVCYPTADVPAKCPILNVDIVPNKKLDNNYPKDLWTHVSWNDDSTLVYSKT